LLAGGSKREVEDIRAAHLRRGAGARQRRPARNLWFPLTVGLLLASAAMADPPPLPGKPTDRITLTAHDDAMALSWSDTEERLKGSIRPASPRAGQPLHLSLQVGSFEGEPFTGPLIITLREEGSSHGQSVTVKRSGEQWQTTFTPEHEGPYLLDVSFRTTRHKALHAALQVRPSPLPQRLGLAVLGLGGLVLVGYTIRSLLKGERAEERPLPSSAVEPVPTGETTPLPATETAPAPATETPVTAPPVGELPATPVDAGAQPPDSAPKTSEGEPPS